MRTIDVSARARPFCTGASTELVLYLLQDSVSTFLANWVVVGRVYFLLRWTRRWASLNLKFQRT